jgi:hypothetical protein
LWWGRGQWCCYAPDLSLWIYPLVI